MMLRAASGVVAMVLWRMFEAVSGRYVYAAA